MARFTGKVGPAVGSSWMGINVIRSLPSRRTNPFTPGELAQQMKFKLLTGFLLRVMPLMNVTFKNLAVRMTGFNKGYSYNIKNVFTGEYPNLSIDYSLVLAQSRGSAQCRITFRRLLLHPASGLQLDRQYWKRKSP